MSEAAIAELPRDMRARLRSATAPAHERLHGHEGFAAAASGRISIGDYRLLLARLYGFHAAFETAQRLGVDLGELNARGRSPLLAADLESLGLPADAIAKLPLCPGLRPPASEAEGLGALYVLEGSTLGGVQIARALQSVLGRDGAGRLFYLGYGERHGAMWRAFLARLEALSGGPEASSQAIGAAIRTFDAFEHWMNGWKSVYSPPADEALDLAR